MISVEKETLTLLVLTLTLTPPLTKCTQIVLLGTRTITTGRTLALPLSPYRSYSHSHPLLSTLTKGSQSRRQNSLRPSTTLVSRLPNIPMFRISLYTPLLGTQATINRDPPQTHICSAPAWA